MALKHSIEKTKRAQKHPSKTTMTLNSEDWNGPEKAEKGQGRRPSLLESIMQLVLRAWDIESLLSYKSQESCGGRGEEKRAVKADTESRGYTQRTGVVKTRDCTYPVLTFLQKVTSSLDYICK